jgi:hypothetical protein
VASKCLLVLITSVKVINMLLTLNSPRGTLSVFVTSVLAMV